MESKALFLDRDGIINIEKNYLYKIEDFEFIEGIFNLTRYYTDLGYLLIIVTNQSGIARGYYTEKQFLELTIFIEKKFTSNGLSIAKTYYCPHHPDITGLCSCRKPLPGMFIDAQEEFNIDLNASIMIGDKESDMEAAYKAGIKQRILFSKQNKTIYATKVVDNLKKIMEI
jgi:D-glycero-D-manno-heptose 1,7-bisphosphate phosphatase